MTNPTSFERVAAMNEAFGNPAGVYTKIDFARVRNQCKNILDEYIELMAALYGLPKDHPIFAGFKAEHIAVLSALNSGYKDNAPDIIQARDALCDIQVFAMGAQHFAGVNGDDDMRAVVDGVMTRFIKSDADKQATIDKHAAAGVTKVYFEGEYPRMIMKSAEDQPDAPKGKFLKSASFKETVFPKAEFLPLLSMVPLDAGPRWFACTSAERVSVRYKFTSDEKNFSQRDLVIQYNDGVEMSIPILRKGEQERTIAVEITESHESQNPN